MTDRHRDIVALAMIGLLSILGGLVVGLALQYL
jgi:hypothetical protein